MASTVPLGHSLEGPAVGEPVILLHGFPLNASMWLAQSRHLADRGFLVVLPDLRGQGRSPVAPGPATMEACAQDVLKLADDVGVERFWLGGLSMGGYVAFELYRLAPERVRGLLLADTRAEPDTEEGRAKRKELIQKLRTKGTAALEETMGPRLVSDVTHRARPEVWDRVQTMIRSTPVDGAVAALEGMMARRDQGPLLPKIRVPTLVVVGAEDKITPPADSLAMQRHIPGAQLRIVTGAAHMTPMEAPDAFNHFLDDWLKGFRAAPAKFLGKSRAT